MTSWLLLFELSGRKDLVMLGGPEGLSKNMLNSYEACNVASVNLPAPRPFNPRP